MAVLWALVLLLSASADAAWTRVEYADGGAAAGFQRFGVGEAALYSSRYGLGLGARVGELRFGAWDVRRAGLPDASGHLLYSWLPVGGYMTLKSWRGGRLVVPPRAESIRRLELYAAGSGWGGLTGFTFAQPDGFGSLERVRVAGAVPARYLDLGVRYDNGNLFSVGAGRFEFSTDAAGSFRRREADARWYAEARVFLGGTFGDSVGGNAGNLVRDPWHWLKTHWRLWRLRAGREIRVE